MADKVSQYNCTVHGCSIIYGTSNKSTSPGIIAEICSHISETEQLAAKAERRAINRMANIVLSNLLGTEQKAIITGITVSGLFVSIANGLAEGFISRKSLPDDFYLLENKK